MKLVIGLGNPGEKYKETRHNVGFMVIDQLAEKWQISLNETKFQAIFGSTQVNGEKVYLLKPLTYMNLSGEAVRPFIDYFKININDLVVIYDDLDLPVGKIRLRLKGGHGGHNGIKSLIAHLGTNEFKRIRIGIDRPQSSERVVDYVLGKFRESDQIPLKNAIDKAQEACHYWLTHDFIDVMNKYN